MSELNYQRSGVDYDKLDAFKRLCQREAAATSGALAAQGLGEVAGARGESAYLIESPDSFIAHVEEGLGSKNLVADAVQELTGRSHYRAIGIDTVATIVNDLITTGAQPVSVAMHAAVGSTRWFEDDARGADLARGFAEGCRQSGAAWGGGETPALKDIVREDAVVLAGSAIGLIKPKSHRIIGDVCDGDAIVMLAANGVHTNGLTLCRMLADRLPGGYATLLESGVSYGEALLEPSKIYAGFIRAAQRAELKIHYAVHITGHGWRKLMRLSSPFSYRITKLPAAQRIFDFIAQAGRIEPREMFATFNMGAGFAVYVAQADAERCVRIAHECDHAAWIAGQIEGSDRRRVEIEPLRIVFESDTLAVR